MVVAGSAYASHGIDLTIDPLSSSGDGDFVVGGGQTLSGLSTAISAHSGPLGEDPRGIWWLNAAIRMTRVTCLAVSGNLAAAGVVSTQGAFEGVEGIVLFRDGGVPGGAGDGLALITFVPAASCGALVPLAAGVPPLSHGNFVVHDAPGPVE